jgi:hypothetical protein
MRKPVVYLVVLLLLGASVGCDSNGDDGLTDAEIFVGGWVLTSLLLDGQGVSALLLASTDVDVLFENGAFTLTATGATGETTVAGTYRLDEGRQTVTLTSSAFTAPVVIDYEIQDDNRIVLNSDQPEFLSDLSGIDLG